MSIFSGYIFNLFLQLLFLYGPCKVIIQFVLELTLLRHMTFCFLFNYR